MHPIELLTQDYKGQPVLFQPDGYINATLASRHFGKRAAHFLQMATAQRKIVQVSQKLDLEHRQIVITASGRPATGGGKWFHPKLAVLFARWLDDDFAWWCEEQIEKILYDDVLQKNYRTQCAEMFLEMYSLNPPIQGYFSILKASSDIMYAGIAKGLPLDQHSVALFSIGRRWKMHYDNNNLAAFYGDAKKFYQRCPSSLAKAGIKEYLKVWHYPTAVLETFEMWMRREYLRKHYPRYLERKVEEGDLTDRSKYRLIKAVQEHYTIGGT